LRAHPLLSVNYFSIYCTVISLFALTLTPVFFPTSDLHFALPANLRQWSQLVFLGICGFVMQFLLTKGISAGSRGNGARATNMIYTNMLFALCLDRWVFGVVPGWWSLAGSGLILGSAVFVAVKKQRVEGGRSGVDRSVGAGTTEEEMGMLSTEHDEEDGMRLRENVGASR
jgi:drug/metabolite transporter (DMT)-like permease